MPASEWNRDAARHLANRAGFGVTPAELDRLTDLGMDRAVDAYVQFDAAPIPEKPAWTTPDPDRLEKLRALRGASEEERERFRRDFVRENRMRGLDLGTWWLEEMTLARAPLREKLTLFLHGHFATSLEKVRDAGMMWQQNDTFRRLAGGTWQELVEAMTSDPAMLVYLDGAQNRKEMPNENFAREVMELFTLGEGNYSEQDIKEAARSFTGYSYNRRNQEVVFNKQAHDSGSKTFFGQRGNFDNAGIVAIIVAQPQASRFISSKMWRFFSGDLVVPDGFADLLAERFRAHKGKISSWLAEVFKSREFYARSRRAIVIKSPVQWYVQTMRSLSRTLPPAQINDRLLSDMGQRLLMPPNVKGWDEGTAWITATTWLARTKTAALLAAGGGTNVTPQALQGRVPNREMRIPPASPAPWMQALSGLQADAMADGFEDALLSAPLPPARRAALVKILQENPNAAEVWMRAAAFIMETPEYQLA